MFTNERNKTHKQKQTGHRVEAWGGTAAKGTSMAEQGKDEGKWLRKTQSIKPHGLDEAHVICGKKGFCDHCWGLWLR